MIPYVYVIVYSSRKMVCNVFWTGSEYKIMRSFIVLDLDLWLANFKRCLIFGLCGLGLGGRTVKRR